MKNFSIILAVDEERGIGKEGKMPWSIPSDFKYSFEKLMYRKDERKRNGWVWGKKSFLTFVRSDSNPKSRRIAVLTRNKKKFEDDNPETVEKYEELDVFETFEDSIKTLSSDPSIETIFICGGGEVYRTALTHHLCDKIFITRIFKNFSCDTFFPKIDEEKFQKDDSYLKNEILEENGVKFQFQLYRKKK